MKPRITPRLTPSPAMMKENSPSCARLKPVCTAVFRPRPATRAPSEPNRVIPITVTMVRIRIGTQCCAMTCGSTIIPTDTKKMAPNRSLMPVTSLLICSPSIVSDRMEPITKAPSAEEKPAKLASVTMPKHRPMATSSRISSVRYFRAHFRKEGMT